MVAVETIQAVYVRIENKPGTLTKTCRVLGEKRLNIDAVSGDTLGNTGMLRILTPRPKDAVDALKHAGIEAFESQVVLCMLNNKPGELGRATSELAAAGINVESLTTTVDGRLALRTSDNDHCAQILRKL